MKSITNIVSYVIRQINLPVYQRERKYLQYICLGTYTRVFGGRCVCMCTHKSVCVYAYRYIYHCMPRWYEMVLVMEMEDAVFSNKITNNHIPLTVWIGSEMFSNIAMVVCMCVYTCVH